MICAGGKSNEMLNGGLLFNVMIGKLNIHKQSDLIKVEDKKSEQSKSENDGNENL